MVSFEDDDDGAASPDTSSENDVDETMNDVDDVDGDGDGEADGDGDGEDDGDGDGDDGEGDNDDDEGDNDDDDDQDDDNAESPSQPSRTTSKTYLTNGVSSTSHPNRGVEDSNASFSNPTVLLTSPSPRPSQPQDSVLPIRPTVRPAAITTSIYDIVPTIAAPHSTSINAVTSTPDMRWIFSGGSDGYIRKFNWIDTANGKLALTVAQRHPFVDSVTKAGVLMSYWENEDSLDRGSISISDEQTLSPVYSLAVHHQGLWLLSGLETGGINLQSVRHEEGRRITCLRQHTNAVSVLTMSQDEIAVLSGSWDKTINDWDLNTGQIRRHFETSGSQISSIELRPYSSLPVPQESGTVVSQSSTFSSNNATKPSVNGALLNGNSSFSSGAVKAELGNDDTNPEETQGSPDDSLFGDNNSLFGDDKDAPSGAAPGMAFGDDDEDEFSRAIASGIQQQEDEDAQAHLDVADTGGPVQPLDGPPPEETTVSEAAHPEGESTSNGDPEASNDVQMNGVSHSESAPPSNFVNREAHQNDSPLTLDTVFLDASIDGTLRIWDRRQQNPIARIIPSRSIPPWCMNACWSPDGNFIYAGRRNGTVDEYSLHKGLKEPSRSFKFPSVSGPVSAVRAMPNGRHLVCASYDILRLYDLKEQEAPRYAAVPYLIVPGHRTGVVSSLYIDPTCSFMISTGGNRGWEGSSTEVLLGYEIGLGS